VVVGDGKGSRLMHLLPNALLLTLKAWLKPDISTAQAATLSSSNSASLPPIEHTSALCHREIRLFRYSELGFCSHTGVNLAHGMIATLSRDMPLRRLRLHQFQVCKRPE
jgi:hypothetical protein